jgi:hypothetical protein
MGEFLAYEPWKGAWGNREVPAPKTGGNRGRRGSVGETWFPPRERAEGEQRSPGVLHCGGLLLAHCDADLGLDLGLGHLLRRRRIVCKRWSLRNL